MVDAPKPKAAAKPKAPAEHPPYIDLISEAIAALKERDGSSSAAIKKYVLDKYGKALGDGADKRIATYIKKATDSGKLVRVKASYKLSEGLKEKVKKAKAAEKKKAKAAAKPPKAEKAKKEAKPKAAAKPKAEKPKKKKAAKPAAEAKPKADKKKAAKPAKKAATPKKAAKPAKKAAKPAKKE